MSVASTPVYPGATTAVPNLVYLPTLSEESIQYTLKQRYDQKAIYTCIEDVLLSVNPYQLFPELYSHATQQAHLVLAKASASTSLADREKMLASFPPHVYVVVERAMQRMAYALQNQLGSGSEVINQSILIGGESGAGKTEATRRMLEYLGARCATTTSSSNAKLDFVDSTTFLEAIGNARTCRNYNSSRYTRWIQLVMDKQQRVVGSEIDTYLLERSRVTKHPKGERNYHILYYLAASGNAAFCLEPSWEGFRILQPCPVDDWSTDGSVDSAKEFAREQLTHVTDAMKRLGFTDEQFAVTWSVLAAILHLGNVQYVPAGVEGGNDPAKLDETTLSSVRAAADLLMVSYDSLCKALLTTTTTVRGQTTETRVKANVADSVRDAIVRMLYDRLMTWLVESTNQYTKGATSDKSTKGDERCWLGMLDVFGFEDMREPGTTRVNSFEQFTINLVNESLQQFFNKVRLQREQDDYLAEGVMTTGLVLPDGSTCIESMRMCMQHLASTVRTQHNSTVTAFLSLLSGGQMEPPKTPRKTSSSVGGRDASTSSSSSSFVPLLPCIDRKWDSPSFSVKHYAKEVVYDASEFLEKDSDAINEQVWRVFGTSQLDLLAKQVLKSDIDASVSMLSPKGGSGAKPKKSASANLSRDLKLLLDLLDGSSASFVKCMNPNSAKRANHLHTEHLHEQLTCNGIYQLVHVMKQGYPSKRTLADIASIPAIRTSIAPMTTPIVSFAAKLERAHKSAPWSNGACPTAEASALRACLESMIRVHLIERNVMKSESMRFGRTKLYLKSGVQTVVDDELANTALWSDKKRQHSVVRRAKHHLLAVYVFRRYMLRRVYERALQWLRQRIEDVRARCTVVGQRFAERKRAESARLAEIARKNAARSGQSGGTTSMAQRMASLSVSTSTPSPRASPPPPSAVVVVDNSKMEAQLAAVLKEAEDKALLIEQRLAEQETKHRQEFAAQRVNHGETLALMGQRMALELSEERSNNNRRLEELEARMTKRLEDMAITLEVKGTSALQDGLDQTSASVWKATVESNADLLARIATCESTTSIQQTSNEQLMRRVSDVDKRLHMEDSVLSERVSSLVAQEAAKLHDITLSIATSTEERLTTAHTSTTTALNEMDQRMRHALQERDTRIHTLEQYRAVLLDKLSDMSKQINMLAAAGKQQVDQVRMRMDYLSSDLRVDETRMRAASSSSSSKEEKEQEQRNDVETRLTQWTQHIETLVQRIDSTVTPLSDAEIVKDALMQRAHLIDFQDEVAVSLLYLSIQTPLTDADRKDTLYTLRERVGHLEAGLSMVVQEHPFVVFQATLSKAYQRWDGKDMVTWEHVAQLSWYDLLLSERIPPHLWYKWCCSALAAELRYHSERTCTSRQHPWYLTNALVVGDKDGGGESSSSNGKHRLMSLAKQPGEETCVPS